MTDEKNAEGGGHPADDVARLHSGSREALAALLERHLPSVRAFVRLRLGPEGRTVDTASDIVQSVCVDLLTGDEAFEYRGERELRGWLHVAALNRIRQAVRSERAQKRRAPAEHVRLEDPDALACYSGVLSPSRVAMAREEGQRLEDAFDALPETYREVVTLVRIVGMSHAEVAEATDSTVAAVRGVLNRALVKLSGELRRADGGRRADGEGG